MINNLRIFFKLKHILKLLLELFFKKLNYILMKLI